MRVEKGYTQSWARGDVEQSGGITWCADHWYCPLLSFIPSQLLKLGTSLLESGHHYLAASRAFIVGICDLAHLGPPEPMMAVCDDSEPGLWLLGAGIGIRRCYGRGRLDLRSAEPGSELSWGYRPRRVQQVEPTVGWTLMSHTWYFLCGFSCPGVSGKIHCEPKSQAGQPRREWGMWGLGVMEWMGQDCLILTLTVNFFQQELLDATQHTLQQQIQTLVKE